MIAKDNEGSELAIDISECRATEIGIENFVECLCRGPQPCEYALPFGYAFLCQHPRMNEIIANTRKANTTAAVER